MNNLEFKLEQYVLGDLPQTEMEEMSALIQKDASIARRVELLKSNNEQLRQKFPVGDVTLKVHTQTSALNTQREKKKVFNIPMVSGLLSALFIAVFSITLLTQPEQSTRPILEITRLKGLDAQLNVYKKTRLGSTLLSDSSLVMAGDQLQLEYVVNNNLYGIILSLDGNGSMTHHFSGPGFSSLKLHQPKMLLPFSYLLDDAPLYEKFYLIMSEDEFSVDTILDVNKKKIRPELYTMSQYLIKEIVLLKASQLQVDSMEVSGE